MTGHLGSHRLAAVATVSVRDAKTHLSRLLRRVRLGEEIVIASSGHQVARLVPVLPDDGPRRLGGDEGLVWIADDFDARLPAEVIDAFYEGVETASRGNRRARAKSAGG